MPELPEVETIAQSLNHPSLLNQSIKAVSIFWPKSFVGNPYQLIGQRMTGVKRRGKYVCISLSNSQFLTIHLRMSGMLLIKDEDSPLLKHEHVIFHFENEITLRFHDARKFGRIELVDNLDIALKELGKEPLLISYPDFQALLCTSKKSIKSLLLDQTKLAGLGNIYVDESLWQAKIHPQCHSHLIASNKIQNLYRSIQEILQRAIELKGTSLGKGLGNYHQINGQSGRHQMSLNVYGRQGKPCPICNASIKKIVLAQRGTHFCPSCQIASMETL